MKRQIIPLKISYRFPIASLKVLQKDILEKSTADDALKKIFKFPYYGSNVLWKNILKIHD